MNVLFLIDGLLAALLVYMVKMRVLIQELSTNPNFGVTTRIAALKILGERRAKRGTSVVTFDVAGMGKANQQHGELWVNEAIRTALCDVRSTLRGSDLVAQLNSGDEFFIVTTGDPGVVAAKVEATFLAHWPGGIYISHAPVVTTTMDAINTAMEQVYAIKAVKKGLK